MKRQDYIHYYLGSRIYIDSDALDCPTIEGIDGPNVIISEYRYKTPNCEGIFTRPRIWRNVDSIKPILRRIEDITEEEFVQTILVFDPEEDIEYALMSYPAFKQKGMDGIFVQEGQFKMTMQVIHHLIKIGVDMFGLIDAGLAIDSKTLK
jgi:hypothetical protein